MNEEVSSEKSGFGFKLGKSSAVKKLQPGVLAAEEKRDDENTEFITGVEGQKIQGDGRLEKKEEEIVIPMKPNTLWKSGKRPIDLERDDDASVKKPKKTVTKISIPTDKGDLESNAINEIIEDAARQNEDWEDRALEAPRDLTIPAQENRNKSLAGGADEKDDDDDDSAESEDAEETDYDAVPISAFGVAMLRGMGWKEGEGIGKTKQVVNPIQAVARPKGLGLGADRSALSLKNPAKQTKSRDDEEELVFKKGAYCQVLKGPNEDMYGEIEGVDEDNARVMLKLTVGNKPVSMTQYALRLVTKKEYDKFSKYINSSKAEKYKQEEMAKASKDSSRDRDEKSSHKRKEREDDRNGDERSASSKSHHHHHHHSKKSSKHSSDDSRSSKRKSWLRPQLRVRIIDKDYMKGRFYKEKVEIVDVHSANTCSCRTDDGKLLEDLAQADLETVIPRNTPYVVLVNGKHSGQLGEILRKDKEQSMAVVQLLSDRDTLLEMSYDDVCEYTGDVHAELDY